MITEHDCKMVKKGYHYKLTPASEIFEPLYAKHLTGLCSLLRDYKDTQFIIDKIYNDWPVSGLLDIWNEGSHADVVLVLLNDHPGLTAMFITTGISERKLTKSDVNEVTNLLMEKRAASFRGGV